MEAPHLSPRLLVRNFTTSSLSTTLSATSSPPTQSTTISSIPTSHSTILTTISPTFQLTSSTTSSSRTTPPPSSFSSLITLSTSTISSSTILSTLTSSFLPSPTLFPTRPTKPNTPPVTHKNIPLYTGIALSLLGLAFIIYLLLRLETFLHRRRQRSKLLSSIPLNPQPRLRALHLPQVIHHRHGNREDNREDKHNKKGNRRSRHEHQDGRRFGVVGLGLDDAGEDTQVQSHEMGRRNREHFEAWKRRRGFADLRDEGIREDEMVWGEESGGNEGRRRERRDTFDAWKRGVVPPLRDQELREESVGERQKQVVDVDAPTTGQGSAV